MKILVVILIVVVIYSFAMLTKYFRTKRLSRPEFAALMCSYIEDKYPEIRSVSESDFVLTCEVYGKEVKTYLDSAYLQYIHYPKLLTKIMDETVATLIQIRLEQDIQWDEAKRHLFPLIKPESCINNIKAQKQFEEISASHISFDFEKGLRIFVVVDFGRTTRVVTQQDLEKWETSPEQALQWAVNNLASKTGPLWEHTAEEARRTGLFMFANNDGYDASRILLPDFYDRASLALGCETIAVAIPMRNLLVAVSAHQPKTINYLRKTVAKLFAHSNNPISPELFFFPQQNPPPNSTSNL
jgi:uncharacterized protein YtpQ (UPF0354 family)